MRSRRILSVLTAIAVAAVALAACGSGGTGALGTTTPGSTVAPAGTGSLAVGATDSAEGDVLAQMYADLLNQAGFTATVKRVAGSGAFQNALRKGTIAVAPERAATFADQLQTVATGTQSPDAANPSLPVTLANLSKWEDKLGLSNLVPSNAVDQNAFVVTKAYATQHHLVTLSDLGNSGLAVKLAAPAKCSTQPSCEPGLTAKYHINVTGLTPLALDSGPLTKAVTSDRVQLGEVSANDPTLSRLGLVVLTDDKQLQNADYLIPIVNSRQLASHPQIATAINPLSAILTTADLGQLDHQIDGGRMTVQDAAKQYLQAKGLLQ